MTDSGIPSVAGRARLENRDGCGRRRCEANSYRDGDKVGDGDGGGTSAKEKWMERRATASAS